MTRHRSYDVAQKIFAQKAFELRETWFASTRELAQHFAIRSCAKRKDGHAPAVLKIVLYASDLKLWMRNRVVRSEGFSEGDDPQLRGKTQLIFSADGVRFLNRDMFPSDLQIEHVKRDG